jgi:hypothetical protein
MLVIATKDDESLLSKADVSNLIQYHNIDEDFYKILDDDFTRIPMKTSQQRLMENILEWTDQIV